MSKPKDDIHTVARRIGVNISGGLFSPPRRHSWKVLDSRELLWTLRNIKDKAVEEHTRNNLQVLIDQIKQVDPDV